MNSASHHQHHSQLVFGQLPPTTYEATPITVDTSSPPLAYNYQPQTQPQTQVNGTAGNGAGRRGLGVGSIKWTKEGVSTSAERKLPFVHRFRPVGLPPPVGLVTAASGSTTATTVQQSQAYGSLAAAGPHINKALNKMSQYETNPVGALQERFQSRGVLPSYRVVKFEGMSHNPVFTYQVSIGEKTVIGSGNSKKQAKHAAARAMLDKLDGRIPSSGMTTAAPVPPTSAAMENNETNGSNMSPGNNGSTGSGSLPTNPIGSLQEYCVKHSLPLPIYDLQNATGQPHQRTFDILAKVGTHVSNGSGTSKKDAKRDAATKLLEKLKALGPEVTSAANAAAALPTNGNSEPVEEDVANIKKIDILTPKHSKELQDFYQKLQGSRKTKLVSLATTQLRDPKLDCVRFLAGLSDEQNFDVTYVDIEERTASGEVQCLVQLSTMPVAVCHGTGQDLAQANNRAARNALEYLKIMIKKPPSSAQEAKNGRKK